MVTWCQTCNLTGGKNGCRECRVQFASSSLLTAAPVARFNDHFFVNGGLDGFTAMHVHQTQCHEKAPCWAAGKSKAGGEAPVRRLRRHPRISALVFQDDDGPAPPSLGFARFSTRRFLLCLVNMEVNPRFTFLHERCYKSTFLDVCLLADSNYLYSAEYRISRQLLTPAT